MTYSNLGGFAGPGAYGSGGGGYGVQGFRQPPPPRYLGGFAQPRPAPGPIGIQGGGDPVFQPPVPGPGPGPISQPPLPGNRVGQKPPPHFLGGFAGNPGPVRAFATGGIVDKPTLALIGEAGPEAVVPLSGSGGGVPAPPPGIPPVGGPPPPQPWMGFGTGNAVRWNGGMVGDVQTGRFVPDGKKAQPRFLGGFAGVRAPRGPNGERINGAANIAAAMGMITQAEADAMRQQALAAMADDYASGRMSPLERLDYENLLADMAPGGYLNRQGPFAGGLGDPSGGLVNRPMGPTERYLYDNPGIFGFPFEEPVDQGMVGTGYRDLLGWQEPPYYSPDEEWMMDENGEFTYSKNYWDWLRKHNEETGLAGSEGGS